MSITMPLGHSDGVKPALLQFDVTGGFYSIGEGMKRMTIGTKLWRDVPVFLLHIMSLKSHEFLFFFLCSDSYLMALALISCQK